jgi:hypothetical protein
LCASSCDARMWDRTRNIIAYPHGWQQPARTEQWAYEQSLGGLADTPFVQLVCFPWATLIDLLRTGHTSKAQPYLSALAGAPPKTTLVRATVCQHIYGKDMLPWFRALKITDLFWTHARIDEPAFDGICVHPFPLYPHRCYQNQDVAASGGKTLDDRKYLYCFVGAYAEGLYLTPVRQSIYDLPDRPDACVVRRDEWHYEGLVYGEQVAGRTLSDKERQRYQQHGLHYDHVLEESVFSLCPSGSGPNSIRLWESLGFGCIPVLLADSLRLPGNAEEWSDAVVRVPETQAAVAGLPAMLMKLASDRPRLALMRQAGRRLWQRYGQQGPATILNQMAQRDWVRGRVLPPAT